MSPRTFYENQFGEISSQGTMTYGQSMQVTVYAKVSKATFSEEDRILLTLIDASRAGGIMDQEIYNGFINSFVFNSASVTWTTSLGNRLDTLNRMKGENTPQKVFDDLKRDVLPIHEARDLAYNRIVSPLMRSDSTDPDLIYLMELCKKLPRLTNTSRVNPF